MIKDASLRYNRQIVLPQIGAAGQQRLADASVLLLGVGGLGSPIALYLAAAGVGRLTLVDYDNVELSNLQRQIIHGEADVGRPKVTSAVEAIARLNPEVAVTAVEGTLGGDELARAVAAATVVVDATDNLTSRLAINAACVGQRRPLVSGAALRFEGQLLVYTPAPPSPCYRCLYRDPTEGGERCQESGVIGPLLGVIGSLQALETIKLIVGQGSTLAGRLLLVDALTLTFQNIRLKRDPQCPVCCRMADPFLPGA